MFNFQNKVSVPVAIPKQQDLVGCLGKMPVQAGLFKHDSSSRAVQALSNWIRDGVVLMKRKYGDEWHEKLAVTPRYRFAWVGAEQEQSVAGIIGPGTDKRSRDHPLVAFACMDNELFKTRQVSLPLARAEFFNILFNSLALDRVGANEAALKSILKLASQACRNVDDRVISKLERSVLGDIRMTEFWAGILPGADKIARARFVRTCVSALQTVLRRTPQRVHWGIRLPLPGKTDQTAHVVFWIRLCELILKGRPWHGQYTWNEQERGFPARLTVYFRPTPSSYFSTLVEARINDGSVLDVIQEMKYDASDVTNMLHIVSDDDLFLVDALERWRSREVVHCFNPPLW